MFTSSSTSAALSALRTLTNEIDTVANRVATGKTISRASDAPAYWSIAESAKSNSSVLEAVKSTIAFGKMTLETADAGLTGVASDLQEVKDLLVLARQTGSDRATLQTSIAGLLSDMQAKADGASINGENLLSVDSSAAGYNATQSIVANFSSNGTTVNVTTIDVDKSQVALIDPAGGTAAGILDIDRTVGGTTSNVLSIDISALTDSTADLTTLEEIVTIVDNAITDVTDAQTVVGVGLARANSQETFLQAQIDANDRAVDALTGANLEQESTRLVALQTQQQLAIAALGISNSNYSNLLSLFR